MHIKTIKELTVKAIMDYWENAIGHDFDSGPSDPDWEEIRKVIRAVREYDHDPEIIISRAKRIDKTLEGINRALEAIAKRGEQ